jgi:hypothetical protein
MKERVQCVDYKGGFEPFYYNRDRLTQIKYRTGKE